MNDFFPIGGVAALGGLLESNNYWIACDGASYSTEEYPELFAVIGRIYGGVEADVDIEANGDVDVEIEGTFCVPDYRGYFLRGTDYTENVDPDWKARESFLSTPKPAVGSHQDAATKIPTTPFTASVAYIPKRYVVSDRGLGSNCSMDHGAKVIDTCTSGGDGDTRPTNIYVAFYIKAR